MAKIPGWLWLIVGIGMYFISARLGEQMDLFRYVSLAFVVIGIFKILVGFMIGNKEKRAHKEAHDLRKGEYSCPRCMSIIARSHRFCPHCGVRLR